MCIYRTDDGKCKKFSDDKTLSYCVDAPCEYEKLSNYDRIRNMSIDEMAQAINDRTYGCMFRMGCPCDCGEYHIPESCVGEIKKWLESGVE